MRRLELQEVIAEARDALARVVSIEHALRDEPSGLVHLAVIDARCALSRTVRELERRAGPLYGGLFDE